MFILWLMATTAQWIIIVHGFRNTPDRAAGMGRSHLSIVTVLGAVPPTMIFLVSAFVLLQAAPTVQFNAGSSYAMSLWSFWVDAWLPLCSSSCFLAAVYLVWAVVAIAAKQKYRVDGTFAENNADGDVTRTPIGSLDLKVGDVFGYWFDFGDDWWHQINVVAIEKKVPRGVFPRVAMRTGESPPQYIDWDQEG